MAASLDDYFSIKPPPTKYGRRPAEGLPARDAAWLCKLAASHKQGGMSPQQLAGLCRAAVSRFCEAMNAQTNRFCRQPGEFNNTLADLLKATLAAKDEKSFKALLDLKRSRPEVFNMRVFDVKVCSNLVKWADQHFDERPTQLNGWLAEIRQYLEAATAEPPEPPSDYTRPSDTHCDCTCCRQLAEFLADPQAPAGAIKARKDDLIHVQDQIRRHQLDAESKIDRSTRPFTLVLNKKNASHGRAVKQYNTDQKLLRRPTPVALKRA